MSLFCSFFASTDTGDTRACMSMRVPGAGGAPRQAQVSPAGRGMGIPAHSCDRNDIDTFLSTPFLSTGMRGNARSPARKQHRAHSARCAREWRAHLQAGPGV